MVTLNNMTEQQKNKIEKFLNFYSENNVKIFSNVSTQEKEIIKNEVFYHSYLSIVKKTANLIKELGVNDPFHATVIFEYLLWNGYLSKNKNLIYSISNRICNIALPGADIMRGKSVCLNNAAMLSDILNDMGIEAYTIGANVKENEANLKYKPNIERIINNEVELKDKLLAKLVSITPLKNAGNHAVTLFKAEGKYFLGDPTGLAFSNFTDFLKAKYVGSNLEIDIKPWVMLISKTLETDEFHKIIVATFLLSDEQTLTVENVKDFSETAMDLCYRNSSLLDDFHDDNVNDINTVAKTLKIIK